MNKSDLLKELRSRTQDGMKDCHDALREAADDLEKAIDIIKSKGQNIVSGRESKVASEGLVIAGHIGNEKVIGMIEVNCQTDFVSRSPDFKAFADDCFNYLAHTVKENIPLDVTNPHVVDLRTDIIGKTKENCVIRRWWVEEVVPDTCKTFHYIHNGGKLGVILSLQAPSVEAANSQEFALLGADLAMQIAAMNPLAAAVDRLPAEVVDRQKGIFETQLQELNKPQAAWAKILDGKFNKWYTEVCLLEQESVMVPKTFVKQVIKNIGTKLGGEIQVINFIRCQVGEGIEKAKDNLADEVAKLV
jgi:elongation factor Ts